MKKRLSILPVALAAISMFTVGTSAKQNYSIPTAVTAPVIDGKIGADEWNNALKIDVSGDKIKWVVAQADGMSIGTGSYVSFMWDANNLYCAANIVDATYAVQPASGGALNSGDGIQLCFYSDAAAANGAGTSNLFWDFLPRTGDGDASTAESYEHFNVAGTTDVPIASTVDSKGSYTLEWSIPWSDFKSINANGYGALYTGAEGTEIILMIAVMDKDATNQALGYSTDEWCVAGSTDVYKLSADKAGVQPTAGGKEETTSPSTSDYSVIALGAAAAALLATVVLKKKKA